MIRSSEPLVRGRTVIIHRERRKERVDAKS